MMRRAGQLAVRRVVTAVLPWCLVFAVAPWPSSAPAQENGESTRSSPKDATPYVRPAVPEEYGLVHPLFVLPPGLLMVDPVVNNTDPILNATDTFNDGETSIAVNPANPREIVITAFSGPWGADAPIWYSTDGGMTWTKSFTVPQPPGVPSAVDCPCDQTIDYGRRDRLSGTFLSFSPTDVYSGTTTDPGNAAAWNWLAPGGVTQMTNNHVPSSIGNADQPWLLVNRDPFDKQQDNVYVAYDNFGTVDGIDMRVAVSRGVDPPNFDPDRQTGKATRGVNPGHRLAVDSHRGTVYSLFQQCVGNCASLLDPKTVNYVLNRSTDGGQTWGLNGTRSSSWWPPLRARSRAPSSGRSTPSSAGYSMRPSIRRAVTSTTSTATATLRPATTAWPSAASCTRPSCSWTRSTWGRSGS